MWERARRDLVVSAIFLTACREAPPPPPSIEEVFETNEAGRVLRKRMHDAFGTLGEPGRNFEEWLARPDICNASNLVTRLEMAAGTFVWPDAFQFRGEDTRDFEFLRGQWRDTLVATMDACDGARFGPVVRQYQRELQQAFGQPRAVAAIHRLLDGTEKERETALEIIVLAPHAVYYERVAQLARVNNPLARRAMITIENLLGDQDISPTWAAWLQRRLDDPQVRSLEDVLVTARGIAIPGAPESTVSLEVRRAAAQIARVWRDTTKDGRVLPSTAIPMLAADPDPAIRREGVVMLEPSKPEDIELLAVIAKTDADPRIRLIAYMKLPTIERNKLPPDSRP